MPSLAARLVKGVLRLLPTKLVGNNPRLFERHVRFARKRGPAEPGRRREARLSIRRGRFGGHRVFTAGPKEGSAPGAPHILFLHGGGYVLDLVRAHWFMVEQLIRRTGATVTIPLYPMPPEASCPDVFALIQPLHAALAARHGAASLTVMGESAGGGMALALAQCLRDAGEPLPGRLVLLSPWLDVTMSDPALAALERLDPMLAIPAALWAGQAYAGPLSVRDPRVSPIFGTLEGLPPMLLLTGTHDMLNADARRLRDAAREAGAVLEFREHAEMPHAWMGVPVPEAALAFDEIAAFMAGVAVPEAAPIRGAWRRRAGQGFFVPRREGRKVSA